MKYDNQQVRRQQRTLPESEAYDLLRSGEYGVLAMQAEDGGGYGIPLSYVVDDGKIYIHGAPEGEKLRCIAKEPRVSFVVVGATKVISEKFTTLYNSIVAKGKASIGLPPEERRHALELILDKYSPADKEVGMKYLEKSFDRTQIIRIDIDTMSGKTKR